MNAVLLSGTKRYRLKSHPAPLRVRDSVQIFLLAEILGSAEAAMVVWTLRGWLAHNQSKKKSQREGHTWTYYSLPKWCEKHFKWLTPKQLGTVMNHLEKQGVIIRKQFLDDRGFKTCYWYRINEEVLAALIAARHDASSQTVAPSANSVTSCAQTVAPSAQMVTQTTKESKQKNHQKKTTKEKQQQQPTAETDVVVVSPALPHHPEAESGEHNLDGEGHDTTAVKALAQNELHHDEEPLSKVPLKVLSGVGSELVKFGVLPVTAQRLVERYPEADIQYVLTYTQASGKLGPGFVIDELDHRRFGVLLARDSNLLAQKVLHASSTELDEGRLEAIRLQNERWAAEDAAAEQAALDPEHMLIPAVPDASDPDALHRLRTDGALV